MLKVTCRLRNCPTGILVFPLFVVRNRFSGAWCVYSLLSALIFAKANVIHIFIRILDVIVITQIPGASECLNPAPCSFIQDSPLYPLRNKIIPQTPCLDFIPSNVKPSNLSKYHWQSHK
jgi:hypothetical protein